MMHVLMDETGYTRLLATAVDQAAEAILVTELDGTIRYVNPAFEKLNGYSHDEATGRNGDILKCAKSAEADYKQMVRSLKKGEPWTGRLAIQRKDGTTYDADVTVSVVRDPSGQQSHYVALLRDITQEIALEQQLRQAQKLESIGQLAAGIAHEINTPIQYIGDNTRFIQDSFSGIVELLSACNELINAVKDGTLTSDIISKADSKAQEIDIEFLEEEIPRAIDESLEGIDRVTRIVRAMKEFSHPGTHEKSPVNINKAIETTLTVSRNVWKYSADVETDLDPELPPVPCLPGDFNQVLLNLVVNASHAISDVVGDGSRGKGTITISTRRDGNWAEIRIKDTGTGIPESVRSRIFDPFFTTKEVGKGTGQGLAISHSVIVDKHNGQISFETEMGKGTTFIIRLPIVP